MCLDASAFFKESWLTQGEPEESQSQEPPLESAGADAFVLTVETELFAATYGTPVRTYEKPTYDFPPYPVRTAEPRYRATATVY